MRQNWQVIWTSLCGESNLAKQKYICISQSLSGHHCPVSNVTLYNPLLAISGDNAESILSIHPDPKVGEMGGGAGVA